MLKVGVLLDDKVLTNWQASLLDFIIESHELSLALIIENCTQKRSLKESPVLYRTLMKFDRAIFKIANVAYARQDMSERLSAYPLLQIKNVSGRFYTVFENKDILQIKEHKLDVLIRFGFGILNGDILQASKYGVWSLHHGDNAINRGGPPAFWEVVNQEAVTGITLQRLSPDLDGGQLIGKSFTKTDATSFSRNLDAALWAGVQLFREKLNELSSGTLKIEADEGIGFYSKPLYKNPGNAKAVKIFLKFWRRRLKEAFQNLFQPQQWSLAYKLNKGGGLETSLFRYKALIPPKNFDWADPFVLQYEDNYHLFFEELNKKEGKAHISYMSFDSDGKPNTNSKTTVLKEAHHLSYPFVFSWQGKHYMLPEAAASKMLCLYESSDFPFQWKKRQIMILEEVFDATLTHHEGTWYLFATKRYHPSKSVDQYLNIYYADDLFAENWTEHPENPVKSSVIGSRPAGQIFKHKDKLIRPAQIGAPKYGYGINFYEILTLSKTAFNEALIDKIEPDFKEGILACHTFNASKGMSVIDMQRRV